MSLSSNCCHFLSKDLPDNVFNELKRRGWPIKKVKFYHDKNQPNQSFYAGEERKKKRKLHQRWFEKELGILKTIENHDNIVRYFTACTHACRNFRNRTILMEVRDGNLGEYIQNKKILLWQPMLRSNSIALESAQSCFGPNKTLLFVHDAVRGLQHLHDKGIIHRNIRPSTVLIFRTNQNQSTAKLGGFNYSTKLTQDYRNDRPPRFFTSKAAANYMAKECHQNIWSKSSDVFALGILLYYAVTKYHPFANFLCEGAAEKARINITQAKLPNLDELRQGNNSYSPEQRYTMVGLIKGMIHHEPNKRLSAEEVFHHPTFYSAKKKVEFLLKIHETVKNLNFCRSDVKALNQELFKLNNYDRALDFDEENTAKNQLQTISFQIKATEVFAGYNYFLYLPDGVNSSWSTLLHVCNVPSLLKALRNKVAHACDKYPSVPQHFQSNFTTSNDSYKPEKFLEVFLSRCPQIVVHLYETYRDTDKARDFYPN